MGVLSIADPDDRATQLNAGRLCSTSITEPPAKVQPLDKITERIDPEQLAGGRSPTGPTVGGTAPGSVAVPERASGCRRPVASMSR